MESPVDLNVIAAIESGTSRVKRRLEIYEADGTTLWMSSADTPRMIDGSVTVDYGRDERRAVDLTLDNSDFVLNHSPDGFWYDKVLKVYRGLEFQNTKKTPSILVIKDDTTYGPSVIPILRSLGFTDITSKADRTSTLGLDDFYGYDILVYNAAHLGPNTGGNSDVARLAAAYQAGFNIFSIGDDTASGTIPLVTASITKGGPENWQLNHPAYDTPLASGWTDGPASFDTGTGFLPTGLSPTTRAAAVWNYSGTLGYTAIYDQNSNGARWFHYQPMLSATMTRVKGLVAQGMTWLYNYADVRSFEYQIGEFCIDGIDQDNFPHLIRVTGRDYTKRLLGAKFEQSVTFQEGTPVDQIVRAVAANGGVTKALLNSANAQLGADITFDRTTERWKAIKDICTASGIEVYFDRQGYLATREFLDPTTSPVAVTLGTGSQVGNLVSYSKKSSDNSIYNIVVVTSENQDDLGDGFVWQARAENNEPSSPTRVSRLGPRHQFLSTALLRSDAECLALAQKMLRISALEEFELNFSSLTYPWLEVGEIARFLDPNPGTGEPDRFLLTSLSIPMTLGPMSGTGKRITIVGSGSTPGEV